MQLIDRYPLIALLLLSACTIEKNTPDSASDTTATTGPGTTAEPTTAEPTTAEPTTAEPTAGTTTASPSEPATGGSFTTGGTTSTGGTTEHIPETGVVDEISVVIETACAPDDGPALLFKYGVDGDGCDADFPEDAPIVNITLFQGAPLDPGPHTLDGGNGFATYDDGDGAIMTTTGTIFITGWGDGSPFGTIDLDFGDHGGIESNFFATFCDTSPPCG